MCFKYTTSIIVFLYMSCLGLAQHNYSSNTAHVSLVKAIHLNNDIIKERTDDFEKKTTEKPLMFVNVKKKLSELNLVSNGLCLWIEDLQKEVGSERILYELLPENFYEKILFDHDGNLTLRGKELKMKIDHLYHVTKKINIHALTLLNDFGTEHFNTQEVYYDAHEKKITYFDHYFYDTSNYGIMMTLNYLLLDVKVFQLMYYRTVMSY